MLEKPIGHDLASARELDRIVREVFDEPQVFRIDHYLGKEAVQNILVFRFANSMVERAWCGDAVDHVQITVAESAGIERRGRYYEEAGALRDMVQNHLLQVLSFVAMEPPDSLAPEDVRDRKAELLEAVRPFSADELVRGQYAAGVVEGHEVPGIPGRGTGRAGVDRRDVRGRCAPGSTTRAGRTFPSSCARASACPTGRRRSRSSCASRSAGCSRARASRACRHTTWRSASSPTRASRWSSGPRSPVRGWRSTPCRWTSPTAGSFRTRSTEAYERLLHDAMAGDQTLFLREDAVERSWEIVAPVLDASGTVHPYAAGTWGPSAADELIAPRAWRPG